MPSIAVLGAGITGVTTAYSLFVRGFDVTVYDRQRYAGMETSFANGGQLSASNAEVWNQWSTVLKGIKWMFEGEAPLFVNPRPGWHKVSWMTEFLANIPRYKTNTIKTAGMAVAARAGLAEMAEKSGVDFDFSPAGILHFYKTEKDLKHARMVNGLLAEGGLERHELSVDEVLAREPTLRGDIIGGFWTESDSTGDIHKFTMGLADWLKKQGVQFKLGAPVTDLHVKEDGVYVECGHEERFDGIVVSAGVASRKFAHMLGDRVNIYPVKGYSITVNLDDAASQAAAPTTSLLDDKAKIVSSRLGKNRLRIAGTAEFNGENRDILERRVRPLVRWCEEHFPDVSTENCVPWAGLRPMMPNMMPRVGPGRNARVFYNTGHGHLGWTLSPATADAIGATIAARFKSNSVPLHRLQEA
ncbi:D-amino acid dehydrogenase [Yoonia sediminilitoris]|uniref:D-amino-acid dehydrogenase n=1 Tax=Yoonia sediminilitoris TaxID=1286148 RepID=A0A2T6K8K0_9RHOB|nr:D-amino acid dehydrogenase [Yoonia sediminilitoris]PUB11029.1 D-amino-acid dehydrogenase [Yoonia sediminilitoris]RCW90948.1 D-amino-acid dehydrogenase [Yoonia sediminilitoris]